MIENYNITSDINKVLQNVDNSVMSEKEIVELRNKMKEIERKLKKKIKPKTITISGSDHIIIKNYCTTLNLNIGEWVSSVLLKEIKENSCIIFEEGTKEEIDKKEKAELIKKYSSKNSVYIKTNKLIINKNFIFSGYSLLDAMPIYRCIEPVSKYNFNELGIKFEIFNDDHISYNALDGVEDLEIEIFK